MKTIFEILNSDAMTGLIKAFYNILILAILSAIFTYALIAGRILGITGNLNTAVDLTNELLINIFYKCLVSSSFIFAFTLVLRDWIKSEWFLRLIKPIINFSENFSFTAIAKTIGLIFLTLEAASIFILQELIGGGLVTSVVSLMLLTTHIYGLAKLALEWLVKYTPKN